MQEQIVVTGIILKVVPAGEYDRRIVLLTKERGKITAFVKGARRQNSRFVASTNLFCFGTFRMYEGKTAYNLTDAEISNYFENLRDDFEGAYFGMYFLEMADYYTRENNDEKEMLKLVYQSLRALGSEVLSKKLVKCVFELKAIMINGEFPGISVKDMLHETTKYTIGFIENSTIEKLYTFNLTEEILTDLEKFSNHMVNLCIDRKFNSLSILKTLL